MKHILLLLGLVIMTVGFVGWVPATIYAIKTLNIDAMWEWLLVMFLGWFFLQVSMLFSSKENVETKN
jgi:hypothetical protein